MASDGIDPEVPGSIGPLKQMETLKAKGFPVAYVGDVVGAGVYRYLSFDQIAELRDAAANAKTPGAQA